MSENKQEAKTFGFLYYFNYFGEAEYKNRRIVGASIAIVIRVYKDGKEVKFLEEPIIINSKYGFKVYLSSVLKVSIDRDLAYRVTKKIDIETAFILKFGWDKIEFEINDFYFSFSDGEVSEIPFQVEEGEFKSIISSDIEEFDISDNKSAQILAYYCL